MDVVCVEYRTPAAACRALRALSGPLVRRRVLVRTGPPGADPLPDPGPLEVVLRPDNPGFGVAANHGAQRGDAPWILFLNPDCRLARSGLEELRDFLRRHPRVAAVGPRLVSPGGVEQRPGGVRPTSLRRLLEPATWARGLRTPREVEWVAGTCLLVRRDAFEAVGGFDPRFFLYFEDVDLGRNLTRAGWRVAVHPGVIAEHEGGTSFPDEGARVRAWEDGRREFVRSRCSAPERALMALWASWGPRRAFARGT